MHRAVCVGVLCAVGAVPCRGADVRFEDQFTASFVTRIIETPEGPMAVCGNPLPGDFDWLGDAGFGSFSDLDRAPSAPVVAGAVPGPGGGALALVSGLMVARRRRR